MNLSEFRKWYDESNVEWNPDYKYSHFPNPSIRPPYIPWICKENVFDGHEIEEILAVRDNPVTNELVVRDELMVKTWDYTEKLKTKFYSNLKYLFSGDIDIFECSIKQWHQPSRLHSDGNDYDYTLYIPLEITPAPNYVMLDGESNISSSLILFNAQNDDVNTIFLDVLESTAESGRKIKNNLDDIKDIRPRGPKANESMPIRKYNNYLLEHIPEKFRTLKRMNIFPYVLGLGIAFKPQYLHCSNFWPPYLSTRTHLLASINLKKRKYWV